MKRLTSCLALAVLGCGAGPKAHEPSVVTRAPRLASEVTSAPPPSSGEDAALEHCLAPIDPNVFSRPAEHAKNERHVRSLKLMPNDARAHFEARRFDLAARGLRLLAFDGEVTLEGLVAGELALEAMNMLGVDAEPPRSDCFDVIASDTDKLLDRYCRGEHRPERDDVCSILFRIAQDIRRLRTETLVTTMTAEQGTR